MLKAIETVYDGYRFRSRLEARWAVFFKTLGIKYEYEKEGYDLDGVYYLPDFWLPELDCFIEIKGESPKCKEISKAFLLAWHSGKMVHICWRNVEPPDPRVNYTTILSLGKFIMHLNIDPEGSCREGELKQLKAMLDECNIPFAEGVKCIDKYKEYFINAFNKDIFNKDAEDAAFVTEMAFIQQVQMWVECPHCHTVRITGPDGEHCPNGCHALLPWTDRLMNAYVAARQARFEHGERG